MNSYWQPYRETFRVTLLRTGMIALVIGAVLARYSGGLARWPRSALVALWPALGGHFVELFFLNWLRPRISRARPIQIAARILVWFIGGVILALCMWLTSQALGLFRADHAGPRPTTWLSAWPSGWWIGGVGFIAVELIAHVFLQLRHQPSFYNGRG